LTSLNLLAGKVSILVPALKDRSAKAVGVAPTAQDAALRNECPQVVAAVIWISGNAGPAWAAGDRHLRCIDAVEP